MDDEMMLLELLFGEQAGAVRRTGGRRLLSWARAFDAWLETREREQNEKRMKEGLGVWL